MTTWGYQPLDTVITADATFFTSLINKGEDAVTAAQTAVNNISDSLPASLDFSGIDTALSGLISFTMPDAPTIPTEPTLNTVPTPDTVAAPTITLDLVLPYTDISNIITLLSTTLSGIISNPTNAIEQALFQRAVDRETALMAQGYQNYLANNSSMGFATPSGQDIAVFATLEAQRLGKLSDMNRDIMINAYQTSLDKFQTLLNSAADIKYKGESNQIDLFEKKVEAALTRVKSVGETNRLLMEGYTSRINALISVNSLFKERGELVVQQNEQIIKHSEMVANIAMQQIKAIADYELGKTNVKIEKAKTIGSINSNLAASFFNVMNYSQSWQYGTHWSGDVNVSA